MDPILTSDDLQRAWLVWDTVIHEPRLGLRGFKFKQSAGSENHGMFFDLVRAFVLNFKEKGLYGIRDHACTDCTFRVRGDSDLSSSPKHPGEAGEKFSSGSSKQ